MKNNEIYIRRFKSSIEIIDTCWIWKKSKHIFGYGQFCLHGKIIGAHRASWILFKGNIPKGMSVCHNCPNGDNPSCCNPDHLFIASQADNLRDTFNKKRGNPPAGSRCHKAILTEEKVLQMRELRKSGMYYKDIAQKFEVSNTTALYDIKGQTWKNINVLKEKK